MLSHFEKSITRQFAYNGRRNWPRTTVSSLMVLDTGFPPPTIEHHLAHADLTDGVCHAAPLQDHHIDLPQLYDDLFRLELLPRHIGPPDAIKTYLKSDHFSG